MFKGTNRLPSGLLRTHPPSWLPILVRITRSIALGHPEEIAAVYPKKSGTPSAKTFPTPPPYQTLSGLRQQVIP